MMLNDNPEFQPRRTPYPPPIPSSVDGSDNPVVPESPAMWGATHPPDSPPGPVGPLPRRWLTVLAWVMIVLTTIGVVYLNESDSRSAGATRGADIRYTSDFAQMRWVTQYGLTARGFDARLSREFAEQLFSMTGEDHELMVCAVLGKMALGHSRAESSDDFDVFVEPDAPLYSSIERLLQKGPDALSPDERRDIAQHYGWFGEVGLHHSDALTTSPGWRDNVARPARSRTIYVIALVVIAGLAGLAGVVLLIVGIVLLATGTIRLHTAPAQAAGGWYAQSFAAYLVLFMGGSIGLSLILPESSSLVWRVWPLFLPVLACAAWPWMSGVPRATWARDLGLHTGAGWLREISSGVLTYLAGLPLVVIAFVVSYLLLTHFSEAPQHPIQNYMSDPATSVVGLLLVASVFAPLTEELMFRGALFQAMRPGLHWLLSTLVTSLIFAAIHPQGWTMIPVLAMLAVVFNVIRQWRGSLIPCMTAHALHNTFIVCVASAILR